MDVLFVFRNLVFILILFASVNSRNCNDNEDLGENNVASESNSVDSGNGNSILLDANDNQYKSVCCGYVKSWRYYAKTNTGTGYFQIWRDTSASLSTWTLVGENEVTHTNAVSNTYDFTPTAANRIIIDVGDFIGMHFPGSTFVTYGGGNTYQKTTTYSRPSTTFNWDAITKGGSRDYAIKVFLGPLASPVITNLDATVSFTDSTVTNSLIFQLTITDSDANDVLTTITTDNTGSTMFNFNPANLEVRSQGSLSSGSYTIDFQVTDKCAKAATGTLTIIITNIPPTIHNLPYTYLLSEDQAQQLLLYTVNVTDPSDDVTCSITSTTPASAPFTLTSEKNIYVNGNAGLDYDVIPQYTLNIQCTDGKDPVTSTFTVNLDPNLPPTINNLPATTSLHEDHILEQLLHTLDITDPSNDTVQCSVTIPASSPFFTKPVSGTSDIGIYVQYSPGFDFNTNSQYDLTISCTDVRNTVTGLFTITIQKNQAPVFTNLDATISISTLSTGTGTQVYRVLSTDAENDQIYYNMTSNPSNSPFQIFASGDIMTTSSLYGTSVSSYQLYIYVYDGNTLVGPNTLTITITDINNPPSFSNLPLPTSKIVPENSVLGLSVHQISVTDPNAIDTHTFTASYNPVEGAKYFQIDTLSKYDECDTHNFTASCSPVEGAKYFQIDTLTGLVSITSQNIINYEKLTSKTFQIKIHASDGYTFISESLNVTVTDVNEPPAFDRSYYSVLADEDLAASVQTVPGFVVIDPDVGETHTFTMNCGSYQPYFTIDSTSGNVTIGTGYDLDTGSNPSTVNCTVTLSDGEYSDTAQLTIVVNQLNDNTPLFSRPTYTFYSTAADGIGTTIGNINATDGDLSTHIYGTLTFSLDLTSISCDCFAVRNNGDIYVKQSLQSFSNGSTLIFNAVARDGGNLSDTASITIVIPQVTTATTTTTTDRYITFLEDSRNSVWLVLIGFALLGFILLLAYFTYSLGWLDDTCNACVDRVRDCCKPRPRKPSRRPPQLQRYRTPPRLPRPEPVEVVPTKFNPSWEAWGMDDFKTNL